MTHRTDKAIVVGTRFGRTYLEALICPDSTPGLAGILARGSERSRACAAYHGVPLYTDMDDLPDDIGVACVVVGSGIVGGPGAELARALMGRGIHVLQEHPLHHHDLAACVGEALRHNVAYRLNTLYSHLPPVATFIRAARHLTAESPAVFVDATAAVQVSYSLLDILSRALGGLRPAAWAPSAPLPAAVTPATGSPRPFRLVDGILRGVPATLRIQNQMDPTDPDSHAHQLHSITIGFEGGHLILADTHGPVLWCPRPNMPRETEDSVTLHDVAVDYLDHPTATVLGPAEMPTYRSVLSRAWPDAIQAELAALQEDAAAGRLDRHHLQAHLTTARVWQDMTAGLGYPDLLEGDPPQPRPADDLAQLAQPAPLAKVEPLVEVGR